MWWFVWLRNASCEMRWVMCRGNCSNKYSLLIGFRSKIAWAEWRDEFFCVKGRPKRYWSYSKCLIVLCMVFSGSPVDWKSVFLAPFGTRWILPTLVAILNCCSNREAIWGSYRKSVMADKLSCGLRTYAFAEPFTLISCRNFGAAFLCRHCIHRYAREICNNEQSQIRGKGRYFDYTISDISFFPQGSWPVMFEQNTNCLTKDG